MSEGIHAGDIMSDNGVAFIEKESLTLQCGRTQILTLAQSGREKAKHTITDTGDGSYIRDVVLHAH